MDNQNEAVTKKGNESVKRLIIVVVLVLIGTIGIVFWQASKKGLLNNDEDTNTQEKVDNNDVNKEPEEPIQEESGITEE
jgi:flagellar basal body-associated protein FliL